MVKYGVFRVYNNTPILLSKFNSKSTAEFFADYCKKDKPLLDLIVEEVE